MPAALLFYLCDHKSRNLACTGPDSEMSLGYLTICLSVLGVDSKLLLHIPVLDTEVQ